MAKALVAIADSDDVMAMVFSMPWPIGTTWKRDEKNDSLGVRAFVFEHKDIPEGTEWVVPFFMRKDGEELEFGGWLFDQIDATPREETE